ncbi:TonB-dependent vitamin B12 receptor [Marinobacterium rhizophilum]|uniref:TonB-dependent vitamin B12 receptor n=1 Tax=Marinobacterium rhizophilum TaxID=420402 RepID=A0ABY5HJZ2_9GAMM|nr:TonB-dependent vitamin B12 receptor [Marinobacterium rhizophilum]UTW12703.1 TonB-dependent vitamin B12 receptor [Marinobacterium rhizophilum]
MKSYSLPAALLLSSSVVLADQAATLSPVIVTATRTAETADETLASVTVIDREQIERSQAQMLPEILRSVPGVTLVSNGGLGQLTSVFLRGTSSDHVLVLIDGIKVGSATSGTYSFQDVPLSQVERIEVVRGPRSSLYGSEAIGGVIQIFTRKGTATGELKPRVSVAVGSHDTYQTDAGLSGGDADGWFNLGLSALNTDGFDVKNDGETDKDGYSNRAVTLRVGREFGDSSEVELHWLRADGEAEFDGSSQNESESRQQVLGARISTALADNWQSSLQLGRSWDDTDNFLDGVFSSRFETVRDNVSWQNDIAVGVADLLTLGLDYQKDEVSSSPPDYDVTERDNKGAFVQYQTTLGQHDLIASLRTDDNEQFGRHNTGSLAWGYTLAKDLRVSASYGTGFKAPTFNDLYWPEAGNETLQPEESKSWELGLSGDHAGVSWSANLYQNDIDNLIAWRPSPTPMDPFRWIPMNVNEARIRGLELFASTRIVHWDLTSSLDLLDPKDLADDSVLNRRARKVFNLSADRDFGRYSLGGSLQAVGKRPDGSDWLGGYTKFDLRSAYQLAQDWALKGRIENLFDKDYQTATSYNQDGRTYWVSLHYAP